MALQSFILRDTVLTTPKETDKTSKEDTKVEKVMFNFRELCFLCVYLLLLYPTNKVMGDI